MAREFDVARDGDDDEAVDIAVGDIVADGFEDDSLIRCDAISLVNLENAVKKGERILRYGTRDGSVPKEPFSPKQTANYLLKTFPKAWEAVVKILEGYRSYSTSWHEGHEESLDAFPDHDENREIEIFIRDSNVGTFGNDRNLIQKALDSHKKEVEDALFDALKNRYKRDGVSVDD